MKNVGVQLRVVSGLTGLWLVTSGVFVAAHYPTVGICMCAVAFTNLTWAWSVAHLGRVKGWW